MLRLQCLVKKFSRILDNKYNIFRIFCTVQLLRQNTTLLWYKVLIIQTLGHNRLDFITLIDFVSVENNVIYVEGYLTMTQGLP